MAFYCHGYLEPFGSAPTAADVDRHLALLVPQGVALLRAGGTALLRADGTG
jgi:hypothetical protein